MAKDDVKPCVSRTVLLCRYNVTLNGPSTSTDLSSYPDVMSNVRGKPAHRVRGGRTRGSSVPVPKGVCLTDRGRNGDAFGPLRHGLTPLAAANSRRDPVVVRRVPLRPPARRDRHLDGGRHRLQGPCGGLRGSVPPQGGMEGLWACLVPAPSRWKGHGLRPSRAVRGQDPG